MEPIETGRRSGLSVRDAADRPEVAVFCAFLEAYVYRDEAFEELGAATAALVRLARRTRTDGSTLIEAVNAVGCPVVERGNPSVTQEFLRYDWAIDELRRQLKLRR